MRSIEWWHCRWPWVTLNPYVIALTLSVLKGCFPMQACALSQRRSASAEVSTHWCRHVHSLVPKCLGAEVSWVRSVRLPNRKLPAIILHLHMPNSRATYWIETTLKPSANMGKLSKITLQVQQWRTDVCRRMVSMNPRTLMLPNLSCADKKCARYPFWKNFAPREVGQSSRYRV